MARWDDEELDWRVVNYENAPCVDCIHRMENDPSNSYCAKYPHVYSIGYVGKPHGVLEGTEKCKFYEKEKP